METEPHATTASVNRQDSPAGPGATPPSDLLDRLCSLKRPFVVAHVVPDADAVGAMLSLAVLLRAHGSQPVVGLDSATMAAKLRFMLDLAKGTPLASRWDPAGPHDGLIVLDTAGAKRINIQPAPDLSGGIPVLNIDHHATNTRFGSINWVDAHASSSCELIARLAGSLGWEVSPAVASLLYAGIHSDTLGFSLATTTAAALASAAGLVRAGADVGYIGEQLGRSLNRSDFDLLRRTYDHARLVADGQIAYSFLSHEDITQAGCRADDIDDQVSVPRSLKGIRIALLFSEGERGVVRVNLRGEGRVTVVEIAQKLGGGGHSQSAGIRFLDKTLQQAIDAVLAAAVEHLRTLPPEAGRS